MENSKIEKGEKKSESGNQEKKKIRVFYFLWKSKSKFMITCYLNNSKF